MMRKSERHVREIKHITLMHIFHMNRQKFVRKKTKFLEKEIQMSHIHSKLYILCSVAIVNETREKLRKFNVIPYKIKALASPIQVLCFTVGSTCWLNEDKCTNSGNSITISIAFHVLNGNICKRKP